MSVYHAVPRVLHAIGRVRIQERQIEAEGFVPIVILNDRGTGVALVMRGPGIAANTIAENLVSHLDIYPTLCDLLALPRPAWLEGQSLLDAHPREAVFAEQNYHGVPRPLRSVRTERYRYIRRLGREHHVLQYACDGGEAMAYLHGHGMAHIPLPEEQLYDLALDPNEAVNVAGQERYATVLEEMRARLDAWTVHTHDGPIPEPPPPPDWAGGVRGTKRASQDYWQQRRETMQGSHGLRSR